jgi:hypothetical protein
LFATPWGPGEPATSSLRNIWADLAFNGEAATAPMARCGIELELVGRKNKTGFELTTLNVRWDDNAYGPVVWALLLLHTLHLLTDTGETIVVLAVLWFGDRDARRFTDASENADYWYFVILAWLPI